MEYAPPESSLSRLIVIASSAGGLEALLTILPELPADFPAAIAIVQHRPANGESHLTELLQRRARLRVVEESNQLQMGVVHLAAPGLHMIVNPDATLSESNQPKVHHQRPSADLLFESAAKNFGPRVIGIVLSGADSDGSDGLRAIKHHGGIAIAQDPLTAIVPQMPRSAIATGVIDFVGSPPDIARKLLTLVAANSNLTPSSASDK